MVLPETLRGLRSWALVLQVVGACPGLALQAAPRSPPPASFPARSVPSDLPLEPPPAGRLPGHAGTSPPAFPAAHLAQSGSQKTAAVPERSREKGGASGCPPGSAPSSPSEADLPLGALSVRGPSAGVTWMATERGLGEAHWTRGGARSCVAHSPLEGRAGFCL